MQNKNFLILLAFFFLTFGIQAYSKVAPTKKAQKKVEEKIDLKGLNKAQIDLIKNYRVSVNPLTIKNLKSKTKLMGVQAVPVLTRVMKSSAFPEKSRWLATFMLGRTMGKKAVPFISKFTEHPHWMLRLASLKVLAALAQKKDQLYVNALKDKSTIVRLQAIDNIRHLKLTHLAPHVWKMLYDKSNYQGSKGQIIRTPILKQVILAMGDLGYKRTLNPMLKMMSKEKYEDLAPVLDSSLAKLTKKNSPKKNMVAKRKFWTSYAKTNKVL
jgi:FOG: HEAT repeat